MSWLVVLLVAIAGFLGAGTVSMWRTEHRYAAGVLAAVAAVILALAIIAMVGEFGKAA